MRPQLPALIAEPLIAGQLVQHDPGDQRRLLSGGVRLKTWFVKRVSQGVGEHLPLRRAGAQAWLGDRFAIKSGRFHRSRRMREQVPSASLQAPDEYRLKVAEV